MEERGKGSIKKNLLFFPYHSWEVEYFGIEQDRCELWHQDSLNIPPS